MEELSRRQRERLVREEDIVSAAEKVFSQKGYEAASMDEIAKEAEFTKRTLYQYFENKEELYYAVLLKGFKRLATYMADASENQPTGFDTLKASFTAYFKFYKDYPHIIRMLAYMGHINKKIPESSTKRGGFLTMNNELFSAAAKVIAQGKADGSIRPDLDSSKTACSIIFLLTGFLNQLSTNGEGFTSYFSMDIESFSLETLDLIIEPLRNGARTPH
ncbi:MAG: TetR/AcrR family transcriptional regulator [Clostridia bacterium]|nr:TetR/AcrR family transcriptional regulator [Clostridia bacterium]